MKKCSQKTLIFLNIEPLELRFRLDEHRQEAYELVLSDAIHRNMS